MGVEIAFGLASFASRDNAEGYDNHSVFLTKETYARWHARTLIQSESATCRKDVTHLDYQQGSEEACMVCFHAGGSWQSEGLEGGGYQIRGGFEKTSADERGCGENLRNFEAAF